MTAKAGFMQLPTIFPGMKMEAIALASTLTPDPSRPQARGILGVFSE